MFAAVSDSFVALVLEGNVRLDSHSAQALVIDKLEEQNKEKWKGMRIDVFTYGDSTLLLARPENVTKVYIAPYALPYLMDYFTE